MNFLLANINSSDEEIVSFSQSDLSPEYIVLLDAHCCVYIWNGLHCCNVGKEISMNMALKYLKSGKIKLS